MEALSGSCQSPGGAQGAVPGLDELRKLTSKSRAAKGAGMHRTEYQTWELNKEVFWAAP